MSKSKLLQNLQQEIKKKYFYLSCFHISVTMQNQWSCFVKTRSIVMIFVLKCDFWFGFFWRFDNLLVLILCLKARIVKSFLWKLIIGWIVLGKWNVFWLHWFRWYLGWCCWYVVPWCLKKGIFFDLEDKYFFIIIWKLE